MVQPHEGLILPHDIIDLIVGELAACQKDRLQTLRVFSLVCSSFRCPAQKQLLSRIRLCAGPRQWHQKLCADLVKVLKHENSILPNIRSLKVVLHYPEPAPAMRKFLTKSQSIITKLSLVRADSVLVALNILKDAPLLEEFTITTITSWMPDNPRSPICETLLEMCSIPKLKTLGFVDIKNLPFNFIMGHHGPRAYTHLALRSVTIVLDGPQAPSSFAERTVGALETLSLMRMPPSKFLTPLNSLLPHFKNLRSLVVVLPTDSTERKDLWRFILGISKSLESLELSLNLLKPQDYLDVRPMPLRLLTALRTLKFTANEEALPQ